MLVAIPLSSVEAGPRRRSSVVWHAYPQHDRIREDDGSERERMGAYGRDEYDWIFGMA